MPWKGKTGAQTRREFFERVLNHEKTKAVACAERVGGRTACIRHSEPVPSRVVCVGDIAARGKPVRVIVGVGFL